MTVPAFTELALDDLADRGLSPEYLRAIGITEREPGVFEIPYGLRDQEPTLRTWSGGYEGEEWPAGTSLGVWWPTGREGANVIVCLGAGDALFLGQLLFSVGFDGRLWRRPDLTALLQDSTVVALPQDLPGFSYCWYRDPEAGAKALLEELTGEPRERVFLTVPRVLGEGPMPESGQTLGAFLDAIHGAAAQHGLEFVPLALPWLSSWPSVLSKEEFKGAKARAALGGILELQNMTFYRASLGVPLETDAPKRSGPEEADR